MSSNQTVGKVQFTSSNLNVTQLTTKCSQYSFRLTVHKTSETYTAVWNMTCHTKWNKRNKNCNLIISYKRAAIIIPLRTWRCSSESTASTRFNRSLANVLSSCSLSVINLPILLNSSFSDFSSSNNWQTATKQNFLNQTHYLINEKKYMKNYKVGHSIHKHLWLIMATRLMASHPASLVYSILQQTSHMNAMRIA